jgi:hypothetical protein
LRDEYRWLIRHWWIGRASRQALLGRDCRSAHTCRILPVIILITTSIKKPCMKVALCIGRRMHLHHDPSLCCEALGCSAYGDNSSYNPCTMGNAASISKTSGWRTHRRLFPLPFMVVGFGLGASISSSFQKLARRSNHGFFVTATSLRNRFLSHHWSS